MKTTNTYIFSYLQRALFLLRVIFEQMIQKHLTEIKYVDEFYKLARKEQQRICTYNITWFAICN